MHGDALHARPVALHGARFDSLGVPWRPYALRHAYAGRLWRKGGSRLDVYTAARLMGHTPTQHAQTYRAHIQPHHVAEAAERALGVQP